MTRKQACAPKRRLGGYVLYAALLAVAAGTIGKRGVAGTLAPLAVPPSDAAASAKAATSTARRIQFGDAWLRAELDFDARTLVGDHYEAPLGRADAMSGLGPRAVLTLDPALQARAEKLLAEADAPAAAIVLMSIDGRLLAIAGRARAADAAPSGTALALQPWAPAASVFKLVTAAALLDEGLEPETRVCYHGGLRSIDESNLVDDARTDRACGTLAFAVARSQNAIIAKLAAQHLDQDTLQEVAEAFGFGAAPAFALAALPSVAAIPAGPLERARAAAGFWHTTLSPLGGAILADVIASGGRRVTPRVIAAVRAVDGTEQAILPVAPEAVLDPDTAAALGEMMIGTTETGTAWRGFHDPGGKRALGDIVVAGKTGSLSGRDGDKLSYSWFVGYAPAESPDVVVSVLLGNAPSWRFKAHTVARLVLETALSR